MASKVTPHRAEAERLAKELWESGSKEAEIAKLEQFAARVAAEAKREAYLDAKKIVLYWPVAEGEPVESALRARQIVIASRIEAKAREAEEGK